MRHAESARYEIKLRCEPHRCDELRAWVRLHPAHWRVTYPARQVNNAYFDTYDYSNLSDNLASAGMRQKLRLRWYGPALETVTGARLELKCKAGLVGWKEACWLDSLSQDLRQCSWSHLRQALLEASDPRAKLWLGQYPYAVLINHYQRDYYATADQTLRLTIDTQLHGYDQRFTAFPNLHHLLPMTDHVIVELKADREHYPRLADVLARFPIRADRFSKYVQGMLATPDFDRAGLL